MGSLTPPIPVASAPSKLFCETWDGAKKLDHIENCALADGVIDCDLLPCTKVVVRVSLPAFHFLCKESARWQQEMQACPPLKALRERWAGPLLPSSERESRGLEALQCCELSCPRGLAFPSKQRAVSEARQYGSFSLSYELGWPGRVRHWEPAHSATRKWQPCAPEEWTQPCNLATIKRDALHTRP